MPTKTIGVDIREASEKGAGKGRYTLNLVKALIAAAPQQDFVLFTKTPNPHFQTTEHVKQLCIKGKGLMWHWNLRRHLLKAPVEWFIAPTSTIYPALAPKSQKVAVVIHDLITFLHAKSHPLFPTLVERLTLPRALKKTSLLLPVSENSLRDVHKLFPFTKTKAAVIASPAVPEDIHAVDTQKIDLPQKFILSVGTLLPRKNIPLLFKTLELLSGKHPDLHLVVVGGRAAKSASTLNVVQTLPQPIQDRIHFLGSVSGEQLCELYSRALVFCFPSLYEGFGIPPLEAMACACPVIASRSSSIPEVVGDAAVLASPFKPEEWAEAVEHLMDPLVANRYQHKGLARVKEFSWERTAKAILENL